MGERFRLNGWEVVMHESIHYEELKSVIAQYQGLIVSTRLNIDSTIIDAAKELRWIGRLGSGMEIIDTEYAASKSISCFSSPEGNCDAVAEHALGLVLSLFHRVVISSQQVKNGIWLREPNRGKELTGKTVGIIGYGHTGSRFAKLLAPFQVNVLAYDKYKKGFSSSLVREVELTEIFELSDVVSLHVPLTEATYHYADQQFFRALKRQPLFINTSRGKVVDTDALIVALDEGRISGAGIDVLENEDLASYTADENVRLHSLTDRDQVIVTPHIAGYTQEALFKMSDMLVQKLETAGML
jgi:D-3-phosphoglycerate dehydrogenase